MYVVEVAPIQRGVLKGTLSFFTRTPAPPGAVVHAPVRGKQVPCITLTCRDAREEKLDVKHAGFSLKKLSTTEPKQIFSNQLMAAAAELAHEYVTTPGAVLAELSFAPILEAPRRLAAARHTHTTQETEPEVLVLQAERAERVHAYRNLVREAFARNRSILVVAPTLVDVERLARDLGRGIDNRVYTATSALTKSELVRAWNTLAESEVPLLLIGTPPVLSFPVPALDAVIVEREAARAYVARTRPPIDLRRAAEVVARAHGTRLILADFPLRTETFVRRELGTADEYARPQVRSQSSAAVTIRDVRRNEAETGKKTPFTPLSADTLDAIRRALALRERVVVYAARKGLAPLTVCHDCGTPVADPATGAPMVLHKTPRGNVFMSHRSGAILPAERSCAHCGSWNLVSLGIGVDRVTDYLYKNLPGVPLRTFTADSVATHTRATKLMTAVTPGTVLVGTERMLPYLEEVGVSVVAAIDSVLALPSWRAEEHVLSTLSLLRERTTRELIVETRKPDARVLTALQTGSPIDFLREEARERKTYDYPPYATFISLSWVGSEREVATLVDTVRTTFRDYDLVGPLPEEAVDRARYRARAVVRRARGAWPDPVLESLLRSLPPTITLSVDPDDIV